MRIKVCGITRPEDALLAVEAGVWAVGFIFVRNTPRCLEPEQAADIIKQLPGNVEKFGVFANNSPDEVINISEEVGITKIQLHGEETPEYCSKVRMITEIDVIKAIRIKDMDDLLPIKNYMNSISYVLLDTFSEKQRGGTGKTFDWAIAKQAKRYDIPLIVAGGLNPDNVMAAYTQVRPFALDMASGVETAPGIKDPHKINLLKELIDKTKTEPW